MRNKIKNILALTLVAVLSLTMLAGCGAKKEINLEDYLTITVTGINGRAVAKADFDMESLFTEMASVDANKDNSQAMMENAGRYEKYVNDVSVTLSKTEGISNGDVITATISYDNNALKDEKFKFAGSKKEITVADLNDIQVLDVTEEALFKENGLSFTFYGTSPMLSVGLESNFKRDDPFSNVVFKFKDGTSSNNLKKGDSVVIELVPMDSLEAAGFELSTTELEVTLDNVPYMIESIDELTDDDIDFLRTYADETKDTWMSDPAAFIYQGYENLPAEKIESIENFDYTGNIYLKQANPEEGEGNIVYFEFSATYKLSEKFNGKDTLPVMGVFAVKNVSKDTDGFIRPDDLFASFDDTVMYLEPSEFELAN